MVPVDGVIAISRGELLTFARQGAESDPTADVHTGLLAALLRQIVLTRGSVQRAQLLPDAVELMAPLFDTEPDEERLALAETELDALLSLGDLVLRQPAPRARIMVEPATPSFVRLSDEAREFLLLGGSYDARPILPARTFDKVQVRGRARWLGPLGEESLDELGRELEWRGLRPLDHRVWGRAPERCTAEAVVARYWERTRRCAIETLTEFEFFDPSSSSSHFRARLREPGPVGVVAATREQRCLAARVVDDVGVTNYYVLRDHGDDEIGACKIDGQHVEARDEWLRLIAALCVTTHGHRLRAIVDGDELLLYFPPPSWLERFLALGAPGPRRRGALRVDMLPTRAAADALVEMLESRLFVEVIRE